MTTLQYIDPPGCGCTDCLIGTAVPLDRATDTDISWLFTGLATQRIGDLQINVSFDVDDVSETELRETWERSASFIDFVRPGDLTVHIFNHRFKI